MHKKLIVRVFFEKGELRRILQERQIDLSEGDISYMTDMYLQDIHRVFEGTRGLNRDEAELLSKALKIPFDELFGNIFEG